MTTSDGTAASLADSDARNSHLSLSTAQLVPVGASGLVLLGAALMRRRRAKARAQRIVRTW